MSLVVFEINRKELLKAVTHQRWYATWLFCIPLSPSILISAVSLEMNAAIK
jgi:hypothetical protein